jgi:hypothetical protein
MQYKGDKQLCIMWHKSKGRKNNQQSASKVQLDMGGIEKEPKQASRRLCQSWTQWESEPIKVNCNAHEQGHDKRTGHQQLGRCTSFKLLIQCSFRYYDHCSCWLCFNVPNYLFVGYVTTIIHVGYLDFGPHLVLLDAEAVIFLFCQHLALSIPYSLEDVSLAKSKRSYQIDCSISWWLSHVCFYW